MPSRPAPGDELELDVDSLAFGGRGVARHGDLVCFVDGGLPGDRVRARVFKSRRRHAEARVVEVLTPGPDRVDAPCRHVGTCGGCRLQDMAHGAQLDWKTIQVRDSLERIGHQRTFKMRPMIGADAIFHYRNKVEFSATETEDGPRLGFHVRGRWDDVFPVSECLIVPAEFNEARKAVEDWASAIGLPAWNRRTHEGLLRHLVVRGSQRTGEVLATIVTSPCTLTEVDRLLADLSTRVPGLVGLAHGVVDGVAETTSDLDFRLLHGRDWYQERLLGLKLRVSHGSFLQTNTDMCERLYGAAIEAAHLTGDEVVWDLYSGIGSIALALADRAGQVIGIEVVAESVDRANENATMNGVYNATFAVGDVAKAVAPLLEQGLPRPDVIVVDPPRAGMTPKAVRRVVELDPTRIVYVSCNPTTLAGNAELLGEGGYALETVQPVDMFPHTHHVECVAVFTRV